MLQVQLDPGLPGGRWACIKPLRGHDEQSLSHASGAMAAVEFLDRLLVERPGTSVGPGRAWQLAISDRDRLLAAVYASCFDDRVESEVACAQCPESSEMSFSLAALVTNVTADARAALKLPVSGPDAAAVYSLGDGTRFRLPNSEDHRTIIGLREDQRRVALLRRCILGDEDGERRTASDISSETLDRVEAAMAGVGPTLDLSLPVTCHECGAVRDVRFDIQHFLLSAFEHEARFLVREIHYVACTYGWSLSEILDLTRDDRRAFVRLIAAERAARQRSVRDFG
jgi:hypothetical protein